MNIRTLTGKGRQQADMMERDIFHLYKRKERKKG